MKSHINFDDYHLLVINAIKMKRSIFIKTTFFKDNLL